MSSQDMAWAAGGTSGYRTVAILDLVSALGVFPTNKFTNKKKKKKSVHVPILGSKIS